MIFDKFKEVSREEWTNYLRFVYNSQLRGQIKPLELIILYPNILICCQTPDHYIVELLGTATDFSYLSAKSTVIDDSNKYFNQFVNTDDSKVPALDLNGKQYINLNGLIFSNNVDKEEINPRLNFIDESKYAIIMNGYGGSINVPKETDFISISGCIFVNKYSSIIRVKHVNQVLLVRRSTTERNYRSYLQSLFSKGDHIYGILYCEKTKESEYLLAGQFANVYLFPNLRETSIGEFIFRNPEFARKAFKSNSIIYEPYLKWCSEINPDNDEAINPDLLIQREDGLYDIYDLKTAALTKVKVTKGKRSRRRFIDYIEEGVAQLAHYEEYFQYPENQQYAFESYGVKINNPRLFLVAGNLENVNKEQVDEACRRLRNFTLIDYDTISAMYYESIGSTESIGPA
jgi:hypothetical protein